MNMRSRVSLLAASAVVVTVLWVAADSAVAAPAPDPIGACCLTNGECQPASELSCTGYLGGAYQGPGVECAAAGCIPFPSLVINELDYDQENFIDAAEFIEIKNVSSVTIDLAAFSIELVDGFGGGAVVYQTIDLPAVSLAAGDYFVICGNGATVANCDFDVAPDTNLIQNGNPDAVAIMHDGEVIDVISYEGTVPDPYNEGASSLSDPAIFHVGLSRWPNGGDTDQNEVDFDRRCITPGEANTTIDADCGFDHGACCQSDGSCLDDQTEANCMGAGGLWGGADSTCAALDCSQIGACCRGDGSCEIAFAANCQSAGETYMGDGSTCETGTCTVGACCLPSGGCQDVSEADCDTAGGTWEGVGSDCATTVCPQPTGACCFADGSCTVETSNACAAANGSYQGDDVTCAQADCPQPPVPSPTPTGACCMEDGSCTDGTRADCLAASGAYQGDETECGGAACAAPPAAQPATGACCIDDGSCTDGTQDGCLAAGGTYQGDGTACGGDTCPPAAAGPGAPFCIPFLGQSLFGSPLCAPCFFAGIVGSFVGIVGMKRRLRRRRLVSAHRRK